MFLCSYLHVYIFARMHLWTIGSTKIMDVKGLWTSVAWNCCTSSCVANLPSVGWTKNLIIMSFQIIYLFVPLLCFWISFAAIFLYCTWLFINYIFKTHYLLFYLIAKSNFPIRAQHIVSPPWSFCPFNRKRICRSTLITMASTEVSCTFYCRLFLHASIAASVTLSVCLWKRRLQWLVFGINSCHQIPEVYTGGAEARWFRFRGICDLLTPEFAVCYKIFSKLRDLW